MPGYDNFPRKNNPIKYETKDEQIILLVRVLLNILLTIIHVNSIELKIIIALIHLG